MIVFYFFFFPKVGQLEFLFYWIMLGQIGSCERMIFIIWKMLRGEKDKRNNEENDKERVGG